MGRAAASEPETSEQTTQEEVPDSWWD